MLRARVLSLIASALLVAAHVAGAPTTPTAKPEDGYLSPTRYLNRYFGLSMVLPSDLNLSPSPVPEIQGVTRWLLGLATTLDKSVSRVTIVAVPITNKDMVSVLRSDFSDTIDKPKPVTIGTQSFWKAVVPRKPDLQQPQTIEYAGVVRDYVLKIRIQTASGPVPEPLTALVESISFLAPRAVAAARTADMVEYAGPALPELGKPTDAIANLDAGRTDGRRYRNDTLGLDFAVSDGLKLHDGEALQAELDSGHDKIWGSDRAATVEHQIARTCTKPLLVADDPARPSGGHVNATVMLTALDPLCLQGARFPSSTRDTDTAQQVARVLAQRIGSGHSNSQLKGRVYSLQGHVAVNVSGLFYLPEPGTGLQIPNRIRMIATQLNGYWVVWTFVAPDTATLERISSTTVSFYPTRDVRQQAER